VRDVVMRVPPLDVLRGLEEREPPVQHAAAAAVQVGAAGHHQAAAGQAGDARLQAQGRGVKQFVDAGDIGLEGAVFHGFSFPGLMRKAHLILRKRYTFP
jgi:hypothetical protein